MRLSKTILLLITAVLLTAAAPFPALALSEPVGIGNLNVIDPLIDSPLVLLKLPPTLSALEIRYGEDVYIAFADKAYAYAISAVKLDGKSLPAAETGYQVYTSVMNYTYLKIDQSNFSQTGNYLITLEETGYYDAECSLTVKANKPPALAANSPKVGEKPIISAYDVQYATAVTEILGPVMTDYKVADGDISIVQGDIIINFPAPMSGGFPLKIIATGYEDASVTVTVSKLPSISIAAKDISAGDCPVFDCDDSVYAKTVTKITIDGTTYEKSDFTVKGDEITLKKAIDTAGTKAAVLTSYSYEDSNCKLVVNAKATVIIPSTTEITEQVGDFRIGKADSWALPEVNAASGYDLLPDILSGKDLTQPMTREEFCELSVRLYEKMSRKSVKPAASDTFSDTSNSQVLKAYALGITSGTSASTFDPAAQINREQCAAMLFRTIKLIKPNGNYDVSSVAPFPDNKKISPWAIDAAKYMNKISIIKGDDGGNFMPKPATQEQINKGYGMAKREETILMVIRTFSQLSK